MKRRRNQSSLTPAPTTLKRVLFGYRRGVGEAGEVHVAGLLDVVRVDRQGPLVAEAPDFRVAIGKTEAVAEVVALLGDGGEIKPHVAAGVGDEEAVIDAALVFIEQHPHLGGAA